ncbi:MAG: hypothetical protein ACXIT4_04545 [Erythrobacter sp.]
MLRIPTRVIAACLGVLAVSACAGPFTGPVEITRFVGQDQTALGQGTIRVVFADEMSNDLARAAYATAVSEELARAGYTVIPPTSSTGGQQVATIRTSRQPIAAGAVDRGGPVTVGVGAGGGRFGGGGFGGVSGGVGINLGGGQRGPNIVTELSVRIDTATGTSLWEGRSQIATAVKSPYSEVALSARTLARGLFKDFPGRNGETITIKAKDLQPAS